MKDKETLALVAKAAENDFKAFELLCERKVREVAYLCIMELGDIEDGQDASQEVFLRMHRGIGDLRSPEAFNVWLNRIVMTVCNGMRRKKMKQPPVNYEEFFQDENLADTLNELPLEAVEREEERRIVEGLIKGLPEKYRCCVMMHYYQKLTYAEIAEILGVSTASVDSNLRMARRMLKEGLEKEAGQKDSTSAAPCVAVGPALAAILESGAADMVTPEVAGVCLSGLETMAPLAPAAGFAVFQKAAVVLFTLAVGIVAVSAVHHFTSPQNSPAHNPDIPQYNLDAESAQGGLGGNTSSQATDITAEGYLTGRVRLWDGEGNPIPLPSGAQVLLLSPQQQVVAAAPLGENGEYRFDGITDLSAGVYTVRAVDAQGNAIVGIEDVQIYVSG